LLTPNILDIATKDVLTICDTKTINNAIEVMYEKRHRDVIILPSNSKQFTILTANDLIRLKTQNIDFETQIKDIKFNHVSTVSQDKSVAQALSEIDSNTSCLCVVDEDKNLKGFVSYFDMLSSIDPQLMLKKRVIGEIMLSTHLKYANMNEKTVDVIPMMDTILSDCIVLVDDDNNAQGIITTKDIITIFGNQQDLNEPLSKYMSTPIQTIKSDTTISDALDYVQEKHFKRLIVEDFTGQIIGQITQEELLARVYSKWADVMRTNDTQLTKVNKVLKQRATKFEEISLHDRLTGVYNRAKFEQELQKEIDKFTRYDSESFALVFLDIDNFKKINDTYGHLIGDNVLKELALKVEKHLRKSDLFARWGGEEFVLILPLITLENAKKAAENIREYISSTDFEEVGKVTCSFGVSKFKKGDSFHSVILRADESMYEAKNSGKNRVFSLDS